MVPPLPRCLAVSPACTGSNGEFNEVKLRWLELLGCILTLRENLPLLTADPQLLGCILTLRENIPFLATDPQLLGCILTLRKNLPFWATGPQTVRMHPNTSS